MKKLIAAIKELFSKEKGKVIHYKIEYYPLTGRYYPLYKGYYLRQDNPTGIVRTETALFFATECNSEAGAKRIIDCYYEQRFKKAVTKVTYDPTNK